MTPPAPLPWRQSSRPWSISGASHCPEGASPIALAGGVYLNFLPDNLVGFARLGVLARRQCRPFDADAEGFVLGEGAGLVALKRLSAALRDGD